MMTSETIDISVRLFGLRGKDAGIDLVLKTIPRGRSVLDVWSELKSTAEEDERLATTPREAILVLVNGEPIDYGDGWETILNEGDELTYMIQVSGG